MIAFYHTILPGLLTAPPVPFKTILIGLIGGYFMAGAVMGYSQQPSLRKEKPVTLSRLWAHAALTAALGWLLCGMWHLWHLPLIVLVLHSGVHMIGRSFRKRNAIWFAGLHGTLLIVLGITAVQLARIPASGGFWVDIWGERYLKAVIFAGGFAAVWFFCAEAVGHAVRPLLDQLEAERDRLRLKGCGDLLRIFDRRGLEQAGATIGKLERFLILVFVLSGQITAIGFLVAAKSIFRFGELKDIENRMESEYITIGTLISFALGIGAGYAVKFAIGAV